MNEADATLASIEAAVNSAAALKADLLVLPECAYPAYLLGSAESYRSGGHLSGVAFVEWLCAQAARHAMHIISGFIEETKDSLYNAAVLIDAGGQEVGRSRKCFLWHMDRDWFRPGREIRAFDTSLGRIGIAICADTRVPEILATLVADGAGLIAVPTCWINGSRDPGCFDNPQVSFLIEARAREFGVPFVCADKSGLEIPGVGYVGMSRVVAAGGELLAEAPPTGETIVAARLELRSPSVPPLSDDHRRRLLDSTSPIPPFGEKPGKTLLAAVPGRIFLQHGAASPAGGWLNGRRSPGSGILVTHLPTGTCVRNGAKNESNPDGELIFSCDAAEMRTVGSARVGCLRGEEVRSFAPARVLALEGADVLAFVGVCGDPALLRARAIENRVYVVGAGESFAAIVGPNGELLAVAGPGGYARAEVDLAAAADKQVAPRTDIFAGRCVDTYCF